MYTQYCSNHDQSILSLHQLPLKSKELATFLEAASAHPDARGLSLGSFLIQPIQV